MLRVMKTARRIGNGSDLFFLGCETTGPLDLRCTSTRPRWSTRKRRYRFSMVDVGQGDGMVLKTPSGVVIAFDGGPDRTGNYADFLKRQNITQIDT